MEVYEASLLDLNGFTVLKFAGKLLMKCAAKDHREQVIIVLFDTDQRNAMQL